MVWRARLPRKKKIALGAVFAGGIFATIAGFLRCILIVTASYSHTSGTDVSLITSQSGPGGARQAGAWSCRESAIAVCVSNIPIIYPVLVQTHHRRTSSSTFFATFRRVDSHPLSQTYEGSIQRPARCKKHSSYLVLSDTGGASKERIYTNSIHAKQTEAASDTDFRRDDMRP